jgi:preprotein translocase subunit SecF
MKLRALLSDLVRDRTNFPIIEKSRWWLYTTVAILAVAVAAFAARGLNFNIDFEGGTAWQVDVARGDAEAGDVRDVVSGAGVEDPTVKILGGGDQALVESRDVDPEVSRAVATALAEYAGVEVGDVSISEVGPTWGDEISEKAVRALVFFFVIVAAYLAIRFEVKMSVAAMLTLVHDLVVTIGVYALFQIEVSPATVVAVLTIMGYSLYDTVVVFDKIRENSANLASSRITYSEHVNRSLNQVLLRSLNTSLSGLIPVVSLLVVGSVFFGALTIRDFGMALFVGLLSGTYSSIFVAAPFLAWWKEKEPSSRRLRERLARLPADQLAVEPAGPRSATVEERDPLAVPRSAGPIGPRPARPRGKKRRR